MNIALWQIDTRTRASTIALVPCEGASLLSVSGFADVWRAAGGVRLALLSQDGGPVCTSAGVSLAVEGRAEQAASADVIALFGMEASFELLRAAP